MAEYLHSISVHIEVETNKNAHLLHLPDLDDLETARREIAEFFGTVRELG